MSSIFLADSAAFYTRAVADVSDSYGRLRGQVGIIREIGRTVFPSDWLPWLIENAGMGAVVPFVPETGWLNVYQQRAWVYYRGTAAAHEAALGWIDFDATYRDGPVDTRFSDHYDLILDRYPVHADLPAVIGLSRLSKTTTSVFHRVIFGHDVPAARAAHDSHGSALRGSYSGVEWREGWPKLSLRATVGGRFAGPVEAGVQGDTLVFISAHGTPARHWRFGYSRHGFDTPGPWRSAGLTTLMSIGGNAQDAPWSRLPWAEEAHGARPLAAGDADLFDPPVVDPEGSDHIRFAHSRRAVDAMQETP
jgi:hypothetical protein